MTQYIPDIDGSKQIVKDTALSPQIFDVEIDQSATSSTRPDITIYNKPNRQLFLVEVAVPFDSPIDKCFAGNFEKYMPLCFEISNFGFICRIVLIFGSLGTVHNRVVSGF